MIYPLEQVAQQISKTEHQLLYHLITEQQETNRLLRQIIENNQGIPETIQTNDITELKRPELMKRMAKLVNKPQGWNSWGTEQIRDFLKGAS